MSVDDRTRLNLHRKLSAVLGPEEADTLMAHLPPVTWDQVATKADIDALGETVRTEMRVFRAEMRTELAESSSRQLRWSIAFIAGWSTLLLTAVSLIG